MHYMDWIMQWLDMVAAQHHFTCVPTRSKVKKGLQTGFIWENTLSLMLDDHVVLVMLTIKDGGVRRLTKPPPLPKPPPPSPPKPPPPLPA